MWTNKWWKIRCKYPLKLNWSNAFLRNYPAPCSAVTNTKVLWADFFVHDCDFSWRLRQLWNKLVKSINMVTSFHVQLSPWQNQLRLWQTTIIIKGLPNKKVAYIMAIQKPVQIIINYCHTFKIWTVVSFILFGLSIVKQHTFWKNVEPNTL